MKTISREVCCVTGQQDLEPLYKLERFPVFMGCVDSPASEDLVSDMDWWISRSSGMIQLRHLLPLDVLYPESHGAGAIGALWEHHHKEFADFVHTSTPSAVLELGGAHGILAREYRRHATIDWTILEPNPAPVADCEARFIKGFFDNTFLFDGPFDTVVHSHLFEHIYEPDQFVEQLAYFMTIGQQLVFSVPNMQVMLERKYTNCINFEHTVFLTEPYIEHLLTKHGFEMTRKKYFLSDHSIFYAFSRADFVVPVPLAPSLYSDHRRIYLDYVAHHEGLIADLNDKLRTSETDVYLFGAHVFAQYLIGFGLDTQRVICLLDNDKNKQGRRLYGTDLFVQAPSTLRGLVGPQVILKAGVYNDEIKKDILENINPTVRFLE
jgi:hypothetical protein